MPHLVPVLLSLFLLPFGTGYTHVRCSSFAFPFVLLFWAWGCLPLPLVLFGVALSRRRETQLGGFTWASALQLQISYHPRVVSPRRKHFHYLPMVFSPRRQHRTFA